MGDGDNKNGVVFFLEDHGIGKARQYASAGVLCICGIELRMRDNLRQGGTDFGKECEAGEQKKYARNQRRQGTIQSVGVRLR